METETINAIKEAIAPLAEKIGAGAELTWGAVLKQQMIVGYGEFVWAAVWGVLLILAVVLSASASWMTFKEKQEWNGWGILAAVGIPLLFLCLTGTALFSGFAHLYNPEFYAIQYFLNLVK